MHKYALYAAYGFLTLSGTLHFAIDVLSQFLRGVRTPSPETTLYYGLHASFALGQVVLGVLGLWLAGRAPQLLREPMAMAVTALAALAWLAIAVLFVEYWQPKLNAGLFTALVLFTMLAQKP